MLSPQQLKAIYDSPSFEHSYTYTGGDLGMWCDESGTRFALWCPLAVSVYLLLYPDGHEAPCRTRLPMEKCPQGVWRYRTETCLHGTYYQYEILHDDTTVVTADPYARGAGLNGTRSMVVDLRLTDPEGWTEEQIPEKPAENIIYETHVQEFSWQEAAGVPEAWRGKYKAFTCADTTLHNDGCHPTGISYLQKLGITYVELMPVYDFGSVDEAQRQSFNWGYDPVNYNIPDGAYATDPRNGQVRIREFKEMIQALHRAGFRVIMDVVYNHTYSLDSCLNKTVPWYYYRLGQDGSVSNGSACGNDIASEYPMCANYILDSVLYWAEEYHIDGFRFDLMGLLDTRLMNRIRSSLDARYGKGEKLVFGEPWSASSTHIKAPYMPAVQDNMALLDENIGIFCDKTRDAIKGPVFYAQGAGFVNGGQGLEQTLLSGTRGWCQPGIPMRAPSQVINYVSSHDNRTLWDRLGILLPEEASRLQANRLAAAIYMTCQGNLFFLSGEEFARTKNGCENSYNAPIALNRLDWERTLQYEELVTYYQGLIALRKQLPGLCDKSPWARERFLHSWTEPQFVGFYLHNGGKWETLCVLYNGANRPVPVTLEPGVWQVLADGQSSFLWKENRFYSGQIQISPVSALILGQ